MHEEQVYTLRVHDEDGHLWAEVEELPGCFASGDTREELMESLAESISLYLSTGDERHTYSIRAVGEPVPAEVVHEQRIAAVA